jgi:FkbM family methyltransferase
MSEKPDLSQSQMPVKNLEVLLDTEAEQTGLPYDENLLERARTQWQLGDWQSLSNLGHDNLRHHPDRAKLALLAAAGHLQTGNDTESKQFIRLATDWGISKKLISQTLVASVHNTLGRAYLAKGDERRALNHFEEAIRVAQPNADRRLLGEFRAVREATKLGLLPQAGKLVGGQLAEIKSSSNSLTKARFAILETEVGLINHELTIAQKRQQIFNPQTTPRMSQIGNGSPQWLAELKNKAVSQLGQDIWVLEKTNYKRGGFFVEFGATNGVLLSNTLLLENEFEWQGICAEPNPKFFAELQKNRRCRISDQYIGRISGEQVEFILADVYGGSAEFANCDNHKAKRDAYVAAGHVTTFNSISLNDFLEQHQAPRNIDYISIDTEGSEYDLLSTFPFDKWNIQLITVEHNFTEQRKMIRQLLESNGYRCTEQQWDDWYEKIKE